MPDIVIDKPECDWIHLRKKDRRKPGIWKCRSCGHGKLSLTEPECGCEVIVIPSENAEQN